MDWSHLFSLIAGIGCGVVGTVISLKSRMTASSSLVAPHLKSSELPNTDQSIQLEKLERQLVTLQQAYFRAMELSQFKAGFLARTSHELRSPINGVIGMHQLILADLCDSPEEELEFLQQAHTSVLKMLGLLDELITISKIEYGSGNLCLEPVQLAELFKEVQAAVHLQAENRNLRLQIVIPDADIEVLADWKQLRQILISLLDTAIYHMDDGQIRLRVAPSNPSDLTKPVRIWLEDQRPASAWREAFDLLSASEQCIQSIQTIQPTQKVIPTVIEQILAETGDNLRPSMGLGLLMNQIALHCMGGKFTILETPIAHSKDNLITTQLSDDPLAESQWSNLTRLECSLSRP